MPSSPGVALSDFPLRALSNSSRVMSFHSAIPLSGALTQLGTSLYGWLVGPNPAVRYASAPSSVKSGSAGSSSLNTLAAALYLSRRKSWSFLFRCLSSASASWCCRMRRRASSSLCRSFCRRLRAASISLFICCMSAPSFRFLWKNFGRSATLCSRMILSRSPRVIPLMLSHSWTFLSRGVSLGPG